MDDGPSFGQLCLAGSAMTDSSFSRPINVMVVVRNLVGGIRTYLRYVYPRLSPERYRVRVLTVRSAELDALSHDLSAHRPEIIAVSSEGGTRALTWAAMKALNEGRTDVIHANGFTAAIAVAGARLLRRIPVIVTSHDVVEAHPLQERLTWAHKTVLAVALGRASIVQSVSNDAQANLLRAIPALGSHSGLRIVHNGIEVDNLPFRADAPERMTQGQRTARLLFVGRLMPQKGFRDIISAVEMMRSREDFRVDVLGDGGFIREYRAEIARLGLERFFHFLGYIADAGPVLRGADGVIMPSLWEACGLVAMEALAAGTPLIAARSIGLREVVADTPALTVAPNSPSELAEAMKCLIQDLPTHSTKAQAFAPAARRRFDVRRTATALDSMMSDLATGRAHA